MRKGFVSTLIIGGIIHLVRAGIEFLNPVYWDPSTWFDYSAVILTTLQEILFALVLLFMLRLAPPLKGIMAKIWRLVITVAILGSFISGVGNLLEDAFRLSEIGNFMFSYGGLGGGIGLMLTFFSALTLSEIRGRWSWFYIVPLLAVIFFSDYGGFITGLGLIILSISENRNNHLGSR